MRTEIPRATEPSSTAKPRGARRSRYVATIERRSIVTFCLGLSLVIGACAPRSQVPDSTTERLQDVARVHGGAGPWAVAGYRMGEYALRKLGLPRQSFDLEIVHRSPTKFMYACIVDGAAAATGASLGKLNLSRQDATDDQVATIYRRRSTGQVVTLKPAPAFKSRFGNIPRVELAAAGRTVITLPDADIFVEVQQ